MTNPDGPPAVLETQFVTLTTELAHMLRLANTAGFRDGVETGAAMCDLAADNYRNEALTVQDPNVAFCANLLGGVLADLAGRMRVQLHEVQDPPRTPWPAPLTPEDPMPLPKPCGCGHDVWYHRGRGNQSGSRACSACPCPAYTA